MLPILLACMSGQLSHNTHSCCGTTYHIIKTIQICIQAVSVIMVLSMMMYSFVLTNSCRGLQFLALGAIFYVCQNKNTLTGLRWTGTDMCMIRRTVHDMLYYFAMGAPMA